ncbi:MAG: PIN domain-containing protein [Candidatus Micrarchaeota archaeon]|nr:PIN domain-containing protein [Candidatus Micrarchaeota archaeon]
MELVADTNIAIAAILRPGTTRSLIFYPGVRLYAPEHIATEIDSHRTELARKSQLPKEDYLEAVQIVLSNIPITPVQDYQEFKRDALAVSPDRDDWAFFAVALQRNCAIWSNEKRLKNQNKVKVYNTMELLELLKTK